MEYWLDDIRRNRALIPLVGHDPDAHTVR